MVSNSTDRFNGVIASKAIKVACAVASDVNLTLSGSQTVNGVLVTTGDRVLVRAQTNAAENGIYDVTSTEWERAPDWDGNRDVTQGTLIPAYDSAGDLSLYELTTAGQITIGSTLVTIEFYLQGAGAALEAGTITNAMLRWDGVDTWRETDRIRATAQGANFQIYDTGLTEFMDVSYVGTSAIFVLNNAAHSFEFQNDVTMTGGANLFLVGGGNIDVDSGRVLLPQVNDAVNPTLAFGDGDCGLYESSDDVISFAALGVQRWVMSATSFANVSSFGGGIVNGNASATVPTINPNKTDPDTGLGSNAVDQLSLIAGGVEMVRLTEDTESLISVNFPIIMTEQNTGPTTVATQGGFWVRDDAPNVPMFTDDDGTDHELLGGGVGGAYADQWNFDTATGAPADPGAGEFRLSSPTPSVVQAMYISETTVGTGVTAVDLFGKINRGMHVTLVNADRSGFYRYTIVDVTDNGTWWDFGLDWITGTGTLQFSAAEPITIEFSINPYIETPGALDGSTLSWDDSEHNYADTNNVRISPQIPPAANTGVITVQSASANSPRQPKIYLNTGASNNYDWYNHRNGIGTYQRSEFQAAPYVTYWGWCSSDTTPTIFDMLSIDDSQRYRILTDAIFQIEEKAAAGADDLGFGQLWVNSADQGLYYTGEAGADVRLDVLTPSFDTPLRILGDINTATPPTTELMTGWLEFYDADESSIVGNIGFDASVEQMQYHVEARPGGAEGTHRFFFNNVATQAPGVEFGLSQVIVRTAATGVPANGDNPGGTLEFWNRFDSVGMRIGGNGTNDYNLIECLTDGSELILSVHRTGVANEPADMVVLNPDGDTVVTNGIQGIGVAGGVILGYADSSTINFPAARTMGQADGLFQINVDAAGDFQRVLSFYDNEDGQPAVMYDFDTATASADPTAGRVRFDNATPASVTNIYIDDLSDVGNDAGWLLGTLADGDLLAIRSPDDNADYLIVTVNGAPTDNTGWWTIPVTVVASGSLPAANDKLVISAQFLSQSGGLADGTTTGALLNWSGSAWVENTDLLYDAVPGEFSFRGAGINDNDVKLIQALYSDGTDAWSLGVGTSGSNLELYQQQPGDALVLKGRNAGDTADQTFLNADADNTTVLTGNLNIDFTIGSVTQQVGGYNATSNFYLKSSPATGFTNIVLTTETAASGGVFVQNDYNGDNQRERVMTNSQIDWITASAGYTFETTTTAADPGPGDIRFNSATPASVTNIYIDDIGEWNSRDHSWLLSSLSDGDLIIIRSNNDMADYWIGTVNGTPTDNTGWWTIPVTHVRSGSLFSNADQVSISVQYLSEVAAGGTIGGSIAEDQIAFGAVTANNIEGSANLTYDGVALELSGDVLRVSNSGQYQFNSSTASVTFTQSYNGTSMEYTFGTAVTDWRIEGLASPDTITFADGPEIRFYEATDTTYMSMLQDAGGMTFNQSNAADTFEFQIATDARFDIQNTLVRALDGVTFQVLDTGNIANISLSHDGTDGIIAVSTGVIQLADNTRLDDNVELQFGTGNDASIDYDGVDSLIVDLIADDNFLVSEVGVTKFNVNTFSNRIDIHDGFELYVRSPDDGDWIVFDHDGADGHIGVGGATPGSILCDSAMAWESATDTVSANAVTLAIEDGNAFEVDLEPATATVAVTLSGGPPTGRYYACSVKVQQDGATAQTLTWAGGTFRWRDGTAHVMNSTLDGISIYTFETWDGGTTWYASGADYS